MLKAIKGDITKVEDVEVIVNAANTMLLGGGGVDGAIHRAAGPGLYRECMGIGGCKTGEAKMTKAYNLPYKGIIHTVGPVWNGGGHKEAEILAQCYRKCLEVAMENGIKRIAFPSISTGKFNYPVGQAAAVAVTAARKFMQEHPDSLDLIEWVLFDDTTYDAYLAVLGRERWQ